jgi:hypothetical protein
MNRKGITKLIVYWIVIIMDPYVGPETSERIGYVHRTGPETSDGIGSVHRMMDRGSRANPTEV